jgi:carbon-monoxide dehydrogenase medium subunit
VIPGKFDYHRPPTLAEATGLLARYGEEARVLAGGHSLIPVMKLRLSDLAHLIDLQDIGELKGITIGPDAVAIGAMTTQHELIAHAGLADVLPILREAALQIADPQVRYCGTIGGNVANGDPGNDLPGLMQCLDASFALSGPDGERSVKARDFYEATYVTARQETEILTRVTIPLPATSPGSRKGWAYEKQKRKIGDYATAAAAVTLTMAGNSCTAASIAMTNLADTPVWCAAAGAALEGTSLDAAARKAAIAAMLESIDPTADNRGPVDFKKHVAGIILGRAIERAAARATQARAIKGV